MNDIELCYFAALIDGLRLINQKANEKGVDVDEVDADALVHYVRVKGDQLAAIHLETAGAVWSAPSTPRGVKIMKFIRQGLSNREIERIAHVSRGFIRKVRRSISTTVPKCGCGKLNTHQGWCATKLARYPKRQRFLAEGIQLLPQNITGPPGCKLPRSAQHRQRIADALRNKRKSPEHIAHWVEARRGAAENIRKGAKILIDSQN